jgi:hypothetical protein
MRLMTRSRRWHLMAAIMLMLCAGNATAWPWSYWRLEVLGVRAGNQTLAIGIERGSLLAGIIPQRNTNLVAWSHEPPTNELSQHSILNFVYFPLPRGCLALDIPLWLCSIVFGYFGIVSLRRRRPRCNDWRRRSLTPFHPDCQHITDSPSNSHSHKHDT